MKAPLARVAAIFLLTIAMAQMYPGIEAESSSELVKILLILLSVLIIGQYVAANAVLFSKIIMAGVVAVALVAIYHLYTFYVVDSHSVSDRMKGYFIPENPLYLAQSFGFFFIAAVYLAVENYRRPVPGFDGTVRLHSGFRRDGNAKQEFCSRNHCSNNPPFRREWKKAGCNRLFILAGYIRGYYLFESSRSGEN